MLISDHIAALIERMLRDGDGTLELCRNDIAQRIGCAPSQINYVIASRFTPARGFSVESKRGGGGYIRIVRCTDDVTGVIARLTEYGEGGLSTAEAEDLLRRMVGAGILSQPVYTVACAAISDTALSAVPDEESRRRLRADILTQMILKSTVS